MARTKAERRALQEIDELHHLAQQVFLRRTERDWSQDQLARRADLDSWDVACIEAGQAKPSVSAVVALALTFGPLDRRGKVKPTPEEKRLQAEIATLREHLGDLTMKVRAHVAALDAEMKKPADVERGKRIAALCNTLEYANDSARHFALKLDLRTGKRRS